MENIIRKVLTKLRNIDYAKILVTFTKVYDMCFSWLVLKRKIELLDHIEDLKLGYVSALVDIYFYGYLQIILPDYGTKCLKGLQERIKHYAADEGFSDDEFPLRKLFIIVTSSGFSDPDFSWSNFSHGRIERRRDLTDEPILSKSGVSNRRFITPVYKVYYSDKIKHVSVAMEGAPCLRQMYDSFSRKPYLKVMIPHVIHTFIKLLNEKLEENDDCKGKCEIIFLDESAGYCSLPDVILARIHDCLKTTFGNSCLLKCNNTKQNRSFINTLLLGSMLRNKTLNFFENYGIGYTNALVDSYFYGYLRIVLPDFGSEDLIGIQKRIQKFKAANDLTDKEFPINKLFVVVTSSGYSHPDISDISFDGRILRQQNLSDQPEMNISGVKNRAYKTNIYKVHDKNRVKYVYVAMEAAPGLNSLYEAAKNNPVLEEYKSQIIKSFMFYLTKELNKSISCQGKCIFVYIDESERGNYLPDKIINIILNTTEITS